jgi:hypothetical protein
VLCCPLGGPEHASAEREMQEWHVRATGEPHPWLAEHLELGLPTLPELERWVGAATEPDDRVEFRFHGDFRQLNEQFRQHVLTAHGGTLRGKARFASARLRHVPDLTLRSEPDPWVNRVFVVVRRGVRPA